MSIPITVPPLGESVSEAIVSTILKENSSFVQADMEILELETDKVNQVLYAPSGGQLSLHVAVGDKVAIGQVIGHIDPSVKGQETPSQKPIPKQEKVLSQENVRKGIEEFLASPQKPPEEIREEPLKEPVAPSLTLPTSNPMVTRHKMSSLRKVIAHKLVEVKNTTAMLTTFNEIDMSAVIQIREREKKTFQEHYGARLGFMSFFVKAAVSALQAVPQINAYIEGEEIVMVHSYDIGIAVATDKGLVVPVVRGCDMLSFGQIEKSIEDYAKKAQEGRLTKEDLKGGSFTITNGGKFGSLFSTPIINPPQSAILGMHAIVKRPVVVADAIVIRPMMYVALSYDHRLIDGKEAVLFLVHLKESLEDPARLLLNV